VGARLVELQLLEETEEGTAVGEHVEYFEAVNDEGHLGLASEGLGHRLGDERESCGHGGL